MADVQAAIAAELAKLRSAYLERLPAELSAIAELAARLNGGEADRSLLEGLHQRLHKLAGSGGTFGQDKLSRRARDLEQAAKTWLSAELKATEPATRQRFVEAVTRLADALTNDLTPSDDAVVAGIVTEGGAQQVRIWLVEDDAVLGEELVRLLAQFGYAAQLFTQLAEAEVAARNDRPDVLIMDVLFSQEGLNATEAVPNLPGLRALNCPFLFISSSGDFRSRMQAARLGAQGFVLKPLDVPKLVERLENILGQQDKAPYRVLIVDDDAVLAEHYRLILASAGMETEAITQPETVIDRVAAFRPELLLMDMHMPGYSGPELALVIRQYDEWIGLPIVYLSAESDRDEQLRALGSGADDFLTKPIADMQLITAIKVRADRARQLTNLMAKDSLTGLLKHARIKEELAVEAGRARRSGRPLSVAMLDIDHFKSVNDTYGHAVGDRVIKALAQLLKQRLRKTDGIGRYGGEEFVALLPECGIDAASTIINDVRVRFEALRFLHEGQEFACTLSSGVACTEQNPELESDELLVAADDALYQAKRSGRNRVCVAGTASIPDNK